MEEVEKWEKSFKGKGYHKDITLEDFERMANAVEEKTVGRALQFQVMNGSREFLEQWDKANLETGDFNLDHIIPISKDGTNNLDNLGVTSARLNMVKSDLLVEELLEVCKDILTFNGYEVIKKQT